MYNIYIYIYIYIYLYTHICTNKKMDKYFVEQLLLVACVPCMNLFKNIQKLIFFSLAV